MYIHKQETNFTFNFHFLFTFKDFLLFFYLFIFFFFSQARNSDFDVSEYCNISADDVKTEIVSEFIS